MDSNFYLSRIEKIEDELKDYSNLHAEAVSVISARIKNAEKDMDKAEADYAKALSESDAEKYTEAKDRMETAKERIDFLTKNLAKEKHAKLITTKQSVEYARRAKTICGEMYALILPELDKKLEEVESLLSIVAPVHKAAEKVIKTADRCAGGYGTGNYSPPACVKELSDYRRKNGDYKMLVEKYSAKKE